MAFDADVACCAHGGGGFAVDLSGELWVEFAGGVVGDAGEVDDVVDGVEQVLG